MARTEKQLQNDLKLSEKLKNYHAKIKALQNQEIEVMNQIIKVENNNIDDIINNDDIIHEVQESKKKRGRPKGSLKTNLIQV